MAQVLVFTFTLICSELNFIKQVLGVAKLLILKNYKHVLKCIWQLRILKVSLSNLCIVQRRLIIISVSIIQSSWCSHLSTKFRPDMNLYLIILPSSVARQWWAKRLFSEIRVFGTGSLPRGRFTEPATGSSYRRNRLSVQQIPTFESEHFETYVYVNFLLYNR